MLPKQPDNAISRSRSVTEGGVTWKDPEQARDDLLNQLSAALQGFANFPFLDGKDHASHHYIDSREAYRKMFREPAETTAEIIHPERPQLEYAKISFEEKSGLILGEDSIGGTWITDLAGSISRHTTRERSGQKLAGRSISTN